MRGDFHMHTTHSDGSFTLEEVVSMAKVAHLDVISITDHDVLDGSIAAYQNYQDEEIKIIVGLELSTDYQGESVHILGYFPDVSRVDILERHLIIQRQQRLERAYKIKNALKEHFQIDLNMDFVKSLSSITRGSIANQIMAQGYPYSRQEIFAKMIGNDCPAYFPSTKLHPQKGIKLIHESGGLAVLAHPVLLKQNIDDLLEMGIDGIEAIYPLNNSEDTGRYINLARRYNLFITAGNDFHDVNDHKHGNIGDVGLENNDLAIFLNKLREVK